MVARGPGAEAATREEALERPIFAGGVPESGREAVKCLCRSESWTPSGGSSGCDEAGGGDQTHHSDEETQGVETLITYCKSRGDRAAGGYLKSSANSP